MRRLARAIATAALVAAALAPPAARAFERSLGIDGNCLWWRFPSSVPVVANVTDGPAGTGCTDDEQVLDVIRASLATWGAASRDGVNSCTSARFDFRGTTASRVIGFDDRPGAQNENVILFRRGLCNGNPACAGQDLEACADRIGCWPHSGARTIALTTTSYDRRTGEILGADMELHQRSSSEAGFSFTCAPSGDRCPPLAPSTTCVSTDLGSIVTHEAGHMLGLDHSGVQTSTMFATYEAGTVHSRVLDADDVEGVCTVYPAGGTPLVTCSGGTTPPPPIQQSSSGGCSTAAGGVLSMVAAGLVLARRRRA